MAKRVPVLAPDPKTGRLRFATVDESEAELVVSSGGKLLTRSEADTQEAELRQSEREEKAGVAGKIQTAVGAVGGALNPLMFSGGAGSTGEAYNQGVTSGLTAGLSDVAERKALDATAGPGAGAKFAQQRDDIRAASPIAHTAGEVMGFTAGATALPASPAGVIGKAGGLVEKGAGLALRSGGGALRQAATTGVKMGLRGAVEGGIASGLQSAADDLVHDREINGEKLWTMAGHGAVAGGVLGGGLGFTGSLAASGVKAAGRGVMSRLAAHSADPIPVARPLPSIDPDAGLHGRFETESPLTFGRAEQPIGIRPQGSAARAASAETPIGISRELRIDPDAGLHAPQGGEQEPIFSLFSQGSNKATRRAAVEAGLFEGAEKAHETRLAADLFKPAKVKTGPRPVEARWDVSVDPDAGIAKRGSSGKFQGKVPAEDALQFRKALPREVRLGDTAAGGPIVETGAGPIRLPEIPSAPDKARAWAFDQAWKAVGAGFGLQTTRYAKEAQRYFANGTTDLGEIALRYGAIDMPQGMTPTQAAIAAARSGTPDIIAPKLQTATEAVGVRIGEITDKSGARVSLDDVRAAMRRIRGEYSRIAGREGEVAAIDAYEEALVRKLGGGRDTSVQRLLEQRKGLDQIVYEETRTLDPRGRVAALRQVRAGLESTIADALDRASGRLPGELRAEYNALKRDYHGLRILTEAAEDSAARSAKGATLGLGEKYAVAQAVATGHFAAAPVLGLAGKIVRERGNAAAAAFLMRASEQQTLTKLLGRADEARAGAVRGVLAEAPPPRPASTRKETSADIAQGRAEQASIRKQAEAVVREQGDLAASPQSALARLQEAGAVIGRHAGPRAAAAYTTAQIKSMQYLMRYVPQKDRRDPLDPRSVPPLTYDEAQSLVRANRYAKRPATVWEDFADGIVTPEGIDAAESIMPEQFAQFQTELFAHVQQRMLQNKSLTQGQRLRIDKLLGGTAIRPEDVARNQQNLNDAPPDSPQGPQPEAASGGASVPMKIQQSGFDAVEARMSAG